MQKDRFYDLCTLGAWCTFIAGALYVAMVICAFLLPSSIATYQATLQYFKDFMEVKGLFLFLKWCMFFGSIAMIGVVYVIYNLAREVNRTFVGFFSLLAIIGYSFNMYQQILDISRIPYLVHHYSLASENVRQVIEVYGVSNVHLFILSMGLPGVWAIAISLKAYTNPQVPRLLAFLGFLWGIGNIFTVIAHVFVFLPLIYLVAIGALICTPVWAIGEGVFFLKLREKGFNYIKLKE